MSWAWIIMFERSYRSSEHTGRTWAICTVWNPERSDEMGLIIISQAIAVLRAVKCDWNSCGRYYKLYHSITATPTHQTGNASKQKVTS